MSSITAQIITFNSGRTLASPTQLGPELFSDSSSVPPDLIVLCLQEIAPIGYAFLGGSYLFPYYSRFTSILKDAVAQHFGTDTSYTPVATQNVGLTALMVFAAPGAKSRIEWVETAELGLGVWDMGNKGAVGARLGMMSDEGTVSPMTFVSAHFQPSETKWEKRNADWQTVCEQLVFRRNKDATVAKDDAESRPLLSEDSSHSQQASNGLGMFDATSSLVFAGDLNYRTSDTRPDEEQYKSWPHSSSSPSDTRWRDLFAADQLTRERRANKTLHHLDEAPVDFPPTYKYSSTAQDHVAGHGTLSEASGGKDAITPWAKHRYPSWCDRILYLASSAIKPSDYRALPVQPTSDHRPVALTVSIPLGSSLDVKAPFAVRPDWRERRAAARRYEVVVGIASYLALTWEGELLAVGTLIGLVSGYIALRAIL